MENSKSYLKNAGIVPNISFKTQPKHKVVLVSDEEAEIKNEKGEVIKGVKYRVLEEGEEKAIFTSSASLISQLADLPENTEVIIELKSRNTPSGWRSYFEVLTIGVDPAIED